MRISARADYAVRALVEIARGTDEVPLTAQDIADAQQIPHSFLLSIMADLRRVGIVGSVRGKAGGWVLRRDAAGIAIADVIRAVDGPLVNVHGVQPESVSYPTSLASLQLVWVAVRSSLREVLEHVTIADITAGRLPDPVLARTDDREVWQTR